MPRKHPKKEKAQRETNKGWAEGAREDFLNQYVDDFARAMGQGASAEDEVLRNVVRRYFFHFDIDDNVEPTLPLKPFDELWVPQQDDGPFEELRKKRDLREKKKKAIRAWLLYRALKLTSIRSTVRRRLLSDAYLALLNKVGKLGLRPPKARSAFQEWQKFNKKDATRIVTDLWDIEVNAGRQTIPARGGIHPKFRQETVQAHFKSLSVDEQKHWTDQAKSSSEEKKRKWNDAYHGPPSTAPEDRAACVKNLPAFLQPVAEGIMDLTGLVTIVQVVGPMGVLGGEMGVVTICSGKNLDPVPVSIAKWDAGVYEAWRNHLVAFANSAYTQADKDAVKLSSSPGLPSDFKGVVFDDDPLDAVVSSMNEIIAGKDTGALAGSEDEESDESDNDDVQGSEQPQSTSRKRRRVDGDGDVAAGNRTEGNKGSPEVSQSGNLVKVNGVWKSPYEVQRDENIKRNKALMDALELREAATAMVEVGTKKSVRRPRKAEKEGESEPVMRRQSGRLNTKGKEVDVVGDGAPMDVDQSVEDGTPMDVDAPAVVVMPVVPAGTPVVPALAPTVPVMAPASSVVPAATLVTPDVPATALTVLAEPLEPASTPSVGVPTPGPSARDTVTKTVSRQPTPNESGAIEELNQGDSPFSKLSNDARELLLEALPWFNLPFRVFADSDWGETWRELLEAFVKLEASVDFGVIEGSLPSRGRPEILSDWIGDGRLKPKRMGAPPRKMLSLKIKDVPVFKGRFRAWWGEMQPAWRKEDESGRWLRKRHGRDFGELDVWGQNGWLSVVACLYWWREGEGDEGEIQDWVEYVKDASWMMEGLALRGYQGR